VRRCVEELTKDGYGVRGVSSSIGAAFAAERHGREISLHPTRTDAWVACEKHDERRRESGPPDGGPYALGAPTPEVATVLQDVAAERWRQQHKPTSSETIDDRNTAFDWHEIISDYNGWARRMSCMGSPEKARRRLVQLAAVAVAAVEAIDRNGSIKT
jgi:phenylpyruvate tautomerase PptA (4-oxalocrotonate tautomerase family)